MATNRGAAYMGPGKVEVQTIDFRKLALGSRQCEQGVILKIVCTNICGATNTWSATHHRSHGIKF